MTLSDDLIQQARELCALDPRRPKQANLRRARAAQAERAKANSLRQDPTGPEVNADLLRLASAFVNLQEARHLADYAPDEFLTRLQATKHIDDSALAIGALAAIRPSPIGQRLLWEMLLGKLDR